MQISTEYRHCDRGSRLWGCLITDLPHAQEIYYSNVIVGKWNLEVISIYKPFQIHVIFIFAAHF
jgi:hypothetical protein